MTTMPSDIPGFYYDETKKKYFKIQPNHIATPSSSKYTQQAVNSIAEQEDSAQRYRSRRARRRRETIRRSALLTHPLLSLQGRLGTPRLSAADTSARSYASLLAKSRVLKGDSLGTKFSIQKDTKHLFCLQRATNDGPSEFGLSRWEDDLDEYLPHDFEGLLATPDLRCVTVMSSTAVAWVLDSDFYGYMQGGRPPPKCSLILSKYLGDWEKWCWQDHATAVSNTNIEVDYTIWDIALRPSPQDGRDALLATSDGLYLLESYFFADESDQPKRLLGTGQCEQMTAAYLDNNIYVSGERSGRVHFGDLRGDSIWRLQHSSAVCDLKPLKHSHHLLVHGLESTCIYDLRFISAPAIMEPLKSRSKRRKSRFESNRSYTIHASPSVPVLTFDMCTSFGNQSPKRYGMGFAYSSDLNVIASASRDFCGWNTVGLWSCSDGKNVASPLTKHRFPGPVTCLEWADLRDEGPSLVSLSDGVIEEWSPSGRDYGARDIENESKKSKAKKREGRWAWWKDYD